VDLGHLNDRFTPGSGHSGNIAVNDRLRPKAGISGRLKKRNYVNHKDLSSGWAYKRSTIINDKAEPAERRDWQATDPRFL